MYCQFHHLTMAQFRFSVCKYFKNTIQMFNFVLFFSSKFRGQLARNHFILSLHLRRPVVVLDIPILKSLLLLLAIYKCYILVIFPSSKRWHKLNKSVFHLLILISWVLSFQPTSSLPIPILLDLFFFFFSGIKLTWKKMRTSIQLISELLNAVELVAHLSK